MAVLTDADRGDVEGAGRHEGREPLTFGGGVARSIDAVERGRRPRQTLEEPLAEIAPEARWMGVAQAGVFVEMEDRDLLPRDVFAGERGERLKL